MARCQACTRSATHIGQDGAFRVRCCSERCGRAICEGITQTPERVHVAAASPLGRALAHRTQCSGDYVVPANVAAQLIGALQRIGPKRPAEDAELPASAQADAPTGIDWLVDLPPEIWTKEILPYLGRADSSAFAAASSEAAALARTDIVLAHRYRKTHTEYDAARLYMSTLPRFAEQRRIAALAFPKAPEMALALMLTFETELIFPQNWESREYIARVQELRKESKRDGDALYEQPLLLTHPEGRFVNSILMPAGSATPVLARAIRYYVQGLNVSGTRQSRLIELLRITKPGKKYPLETPSSVPFFSVGHLLMIPLQNYERQTFDLASLQRRGVKLDRYDAALWAFHFSACFRPLTVNILNNIPGIRFDLPRTQAGQYTMLGMAMIVFRIRPSHYKIFRKILRNHGVLDNELVQPLEFGDPAGRNILFYDHLFALSPWYYIVKLCYRHRPAMLAEPSLDGVRPFEKYIATNHMVHVISILRAAPPGSSGFMAWRPFDPAIVGGIQTQPRLLEKPLWYQRRLVAEILNPSHSTLESIDESYELFEYAQHLAALAQEAYDNGNLKRLGKVQAILEIIIDALPEETTHAAEYSTIRFDGMDPWLRSRFLALTPPS